MKRLVLPALVIVAMGVLGWLLASNPGAASADWLGWRIDTSAALVAVLMFLMALATAALWSVLSWMLRAPARAARRRLEAKRNEASAALTRGWLALAAGDAFEARRQAAHAGAVDESAAPRLLSAQAAEAAGDDAAAQAAYAALLEVPEARAAARAGLARLEARRPPITDDADPPPPGSVQEPDEVAAEPLTLQR